MEYGPGNIKKTKKSHTKERGPTTPYIVENRKKEATRRERSQKKHEKGENDIKQEQVKKGGGVRHHRLNRNVELYLVMGP